MEVFLESLTENNRRDLRVLHLFPHESWLRHGSFRMLLLTMECALPGKAHHYHYALVWLNSSGPLRMDVDLGVWRQFPKLRRRGVRTIRLELETLVEKVGQLITIMDQIRERHGTVEGGWVMKPMS
jgi:hypothetical protein